MLTEIGHGSPTYDKFVNVNVNVSLRSEFHVLSSVF